MSSAKSLGTRHVCWNCGAKFYDLNKPSPACPKCGADPREAPKVVTPPPSTRKSRPAKDEFEEEVETAEEEEDFAEEGFEESDDFGEEEEL